VHRSSSRLVAVLAASSLVIAACSGGDGDADNITTTPQTTASSPATSTTTTVTTAPATSPSTSASTTDPVVVQTTTPSTVVDTGVETDEDVVIIDDLDDVPEECRAALADFLREIEPVVSEVDWDTATLADFETISTEIEDEGEAFDQASEACDENFDFASDEESIAAMIEFAEQEAPGTVGWLEYLSAFASDDVAEGAPETCDDAIAYLESLIADGVATMNDLTPDQFGLVTASFNVISTECTPEQLDEFYAREDIAAFLS
jgi:hypothetical protein